MWLLVSFRVRCMREWLVCLRVVMFLILCCVWLVCWNSCLSLGEVVLFLWVDFNVWCIWLVILFLLEMMDFSLEVIEKRCLVMWCFECMV